MSSTPTVPIPGIPVRLGPLEVIIPPLNFGQLRQFKEELGELRALKPEEVGTEVVERVLEKAVPILHAAIQRNYPEFEKSKLEELLDIGNFGECIQAVMAASGLKRVTAHSPGEQTPVQVSSPTSSGPTSTV